MLPCAVFALSYFILKPPLKRGGKARRPITLRPGNTGANFAPWFWLCQLAIGEYRRPNDRAPITLPRVIRANGARGRERPGIGQGFHCGAVRIAWHASAASSNVSKSARASAQPGLGAFALSKTIQRPGESAVPRFGHRETLDRPGIAARCVTFSHGVVISICPCTVRSMPRNNSRHCRDWLPARYRTWPARTNGSYFHLKASAMNSKRNGSATTHTAARVSPIRSRIGMSGGKITIDPFRL